VLQGLRTLPAIATSLSTALPTPRIEWRGCSFTAGGDPANNRIDNLRLLSHTRNLQARRKARSDSTSGFLGVSYRNDNGKWQARIQRFKKSISLGTFDTPEEAHLVYLLYKNNF
jgi:hypothetical protein